MANVLKQVWHRLEACDAQACRLLFLAEGSTIPGSMLVQQSKLGHPTNDCPHLHRLAAPVSPGRPFFVTFGYSSNAFAFEMDAPDGHAVCLVFNDSNRGRESNYSGPGEK